ncbi:MAG: rRNA maturation RNase YbeY [Balneolaceae bacterium]|nr:rRNA maturation RNase YbeY [Balneolaceae bacterium]
MSGTKADVQFFNETTLDLPISKNDLKGIVSLIESKESIHYSFVEFVFVDEDQIVEINKEHLDREYITDTISFNYEKSQKDDIEGTVFLCAPRINEQAIEFNQDQRDEFLRVSIHSLLHLIGYEDTEESDQQIMTQKEDEYLSLLKG